FNMAGARLTNSGTTALHLALLALEIKPGDEIILPTYTCVALLNAINYIQAKPVFVDNYFEPEQMDFNLSIEAVKAKITKRTKAIIVPHMFGVPAQINKLLNLGISIIEDGTLSLGVLLKGKPIGSFGDISVFSFHASKVIAAGEGGVILAKKRKHMQKIKEMLEWEEEQIKIRAAHKRKIKYIIGYNYRLNDIGAALGLNQWQKLRQLIRVRQTIAKTYYQSFEKIKNIVIPDPKKGLSNTYFRYLICLKNQKTVQVIEKFRQKGIEVGRGVYPPLHYYQKMQTGTFPNAEKAVASLISLPIYPVLTEKAIKYIINSAIRILSDE
ncbi:DegT/DnrJ/EryC1/StrS family aminotransferase, partial [Candidatus Margulisiibacteriota bacterium]